MYLKTVKAIGLIIALTWFAGCQASPQAKGMNSSSAPAVNPPSPQLTTPTAANAQPQPNAETTQVAPAQTAKPPRTKKPAAKPAPAIAANVTSAEPATATLETLVATSKAETENPVPQAEGDVTTVTGCLERDGEGFQLKNPSGEQIRKTRSWKSGFLRRGSRNISIVGSPTSLNLESRIGYKVAIGGNLVERELRPNSIHSTSERCE
jgi:hypothetical protein